MSLIPYVVILPDGTEYFEDAYDAETVARNAVKKKDYQSTRKNPIPIVVKVHQLSVKAGKIQRSHGRDIRVTPPPKPLTEAEFNLELQEVLAALPKAFHPYVTSVSWDDGHACGYEEVINCARNIVNALKPAVNRYTKELQG